MAADSKSEWHLQWNALVARKTDSFFSIENSEITFRHDFHSQQMKKCMNVASGNDGGAGHHVLLRCLLINTQACVLPSLSFAVLWLLLLFIAFLGFVYTFFYEFMHDIEFRKHKRSRQSCDRQHPEYCDERRASTITITTTCAFLCRTQRLPVIFSYGAIWRDLARSLPKFVYSHSFYYSRTCVLLFISNARANKHENVKANYARFASVVTKWVYVATAARCCLCTRGTIYWVSQVFWLTHENGKSTTFDYY